MGKKTKDIIKNLNTRIEDLEKTNSDHLMHASKMRKEYLKLYAILKAVSAPDCPAMLQAKRFMNSHQTLEDHQ